MNRLHNKQFLIRNLCFMHGVIVASVPLLEFALKYAAGDLADYYRFHVEQERGHDALLRDDLLRLGVTVIPFGYKEAQIAGSQYYMIAHVHPALLLGYMRALESNALSEDVVDSLEKAHGVELTCLRHHAKADVAHTKELDDQIAALPPELRNYVVWNEDQTLKFMMDVFDGMALFKEAA